MLEVAAWLDRVVVAAHGGEERRQLGDRKGEGYLGPGKIGRKEGPPR